MKKHKKGQVAQYLIFFGIALLIIVIASIFAPMGTMFNTKLYLAGQDILERAEPDIASISDATIRAEVNASMQSALSAGSNNIAVNNSIFQWGWVAVIIVFFISLFIITRKQVEVQNNGFV